ncbi:divisome protein SepX/GlpR [Nocardioides acrostichi]|uniref:Uncharacterized protein n=1 Tax=Nocardioides acrostichi TaxID=2784339 RepID=A0A930V5P6_9ACTN|nr:hypothetical protein [Nocardioides acrostichi]MBF4163654.1 hypothetical protein [Nocardioides acrostichi]
MDLSALIFVALAVAWAVYLVPKAIKHHDEVVRSRSVDRFSHTMRVLARREPLNRSDSRLVVTPGRRTSVPLVERKAGSSEAVEAPAPRVLTADQRREAANRAARKRRRVLLALLGAIVAVTLLAGLSVVHWWYLAVPVTMLVAWLVACRLMVRRERGLAGPLARIPGPAITDTGDIVRPGATPPSGPGRGHDDDRTADVPAVKAPLAAEAPAAHEAAPAQQAQARAHAEAADQEGLWDPLPVQLPTYVTKPRAARRTVRTIDLDSTGVWTSGRTDADAALAREADAQRQKPDRGEQDDQRRASGS